MVAISLTHDNVRDMVHRLRQFLAAGGTSIKQTHAYEALDPALDHRGFGTWRTDGVPYFMWAWETDVDMLLSEQLQLASMALKFNGDALVRLRDVATLHVRTRRVPETQK